ncbi:MAG: DNA-binding transcriptional regulator [Planctomycetales bacterium]|nr:DNA-binding transcriptional regulator [Planctomycetales bacterium]
MAFPRGGHLEVLIEGVLSYASEHDLDWSYVAALESHVLSVVDLVDWPGDGILSAINTKEEAACAAAMKTPIVNVSSALPESPVPACVIDNSAMGRLAAEHLISKGFRSFAYYGLRDVTYSDERQSGFEAVVRQADYPHDAFLAFPTYHHRGSNWLQQSRALSEWLQSVEKPVGLFAVSDYRARTALEACRALGLKVPEDVAILGTGNEDLVCSHVRPTLTSVARNNRLQGYRSAQLLHMMMLGQVPPADEPPIPPLEVVERESTQTFAVADPRLREAMQYLHDHLHEPLFTIDDVARHATVSRRWLEYAFREALEETPYQYLRRQRLARARRLLIDEPEEKIYRIAQQSGFSSAKQLAISFQQELGLSPREYRRSVRS